MASSWLQKTTSMLSGIGVGAAVMYLFDPERGPKRRQRIASSAQDAWESTGDTLGSVWHSFKDKAGDVTDSIRDYAGSSFGSMRDLPEQASKFGQKAGRNLQSYFGKGRYSSSAPGFFSIASTACLALGVGAALMYIFDPSLGSSRRKFIADKTRDASKSAGKMASDVAHDVSSRVSSIMPGSGEHLKQKVLSEISHEIGDVTGLDITVKGGKVTVKGSLPTYQRDTVISCIRRVEGVTDVDDKISVFESTGTSGPEQRL